MHDLGPRRRRGAAVLSEKSNRSSANAEERLLVVMGESVGLEGALRQTERYQLVNLK